MLLKYFILLNKNICLAYGSLPFYAMPFPKFINLLVIECGKLYKLPGWVESLPSFGGDVTSVGRNGGGYARQGTNGCNELCLFVSVSGGIC
jgi:hypothetical protein